MENLNLSKGIISHDELLVIAEYLFENYEKLCDIIKDKFNFILIDEYQDTSELVIRIFLDHFRKGSKKEYNRFFGDAMQSIYEDGIGDLNKYKENAGGLVQEVKVARKQKKSTECN
ncbi:UvrD-helicase domain-containing protein [Chryseobacterium sp. Marseille-Q8038]